MLNFEFYNPMTIAFGRDTIAKIVHLVPPTACIVILYGGASA